MLIVADENIPLLDAFFQGFGEIRRVPGRSLDRATVEQADVLLVRSVTNVNRALLEGSKVRFVGTCTIGTDHLDLDYFKQAGIQLVQRAGLQCPWRGGLRAGQPADPRPRSKAPTSTNAPMALSAPVKWAGGWSRCCKGLGWNVLVVRPAAADRRRGRLCEPGADHRAV